MSEPAIRVRNLVKVYARRGQPAVRAIDGLTFDVARGAIFGLLGPNGAGKTTLLRVLSTLVRPTSGAASVLGHDVVAAPLDVRRRISVVIQETAVELFLIGAGQPRHLRAVPRRCAPPRSGRAPSG